MKYDVCLYEGIEEIGGFHTNDIKISELLEIIKDEYADYNITRISINKL